MTSSKWITSYVTMDMPDERILILFNEFIPIVSGAGVEKTVKFGRKTWSLHKLSCGSEFIQDSLNVSCNVIHES